MRGRNDKIYISKASMQILWGGKLSTEAMSSIQENMYWLWEKWSLPEGVHEQKKPRQSMKSGNRGGTRTQ